MHVLVILGIVAVIAMVAYLIYDWKKNFESPEGAELQRDVDAADRGNSRLVGGGSRLVGVQLKKPEPGPYSISPGLTRDEATTLHRSFDANRQNTNDDGTNNLVTAIMVGAVVNNLLSEPSQAAPQTYEAPPAADPTPSSIPDGLGATIDPSPSYSPDPSPSYSVDSSPSWSDTSSSSSFSDSSNSW